jgi:hypothetical protein
MSMLHTEFKIALKVLRVTQVQFAKWIGCDPTIVNRWANGKAVVPLYVERLVNLSKAYHDVIDDDFAGLLAGDEFEMSDYNIFGFTEPVSQDVLKKAYRSMMKIYHSDHNKKVNNDAAAVKINLAYERLIKTYAMRK